MKKKLVVAGFLAVSLIVAGGLYIQSADALAKKQMKAPAKKKVTEVKVAQCFECHDKEIKQFHTTGKHAKVNCAYCHDGLDKHLKDPGPNTRPATDVSWEGCGQCHQNQYNTFLKEAHHRQLAMKNLS